LCLDSKPRSGTRDRRAFLPVKINNVGAQALDDGGAMVTMISEDFAREAKVTAVPGQVIRIKGTTLQKFVEMPYVLCNLEVPVRANSQFTYFVKFVMKVVISAALNGSSYPALIGTDVREALKLDVGPTPPSEDEDDVMPTLEEGSILIGVAMAPSISLEEGTKLIMAMEREIVPFAPVDEVISRIGRPEAGSHPHPVNYAEVHIELKPFREWETFENKAELIEAMDGPEGLIICPYIAPAIELDRGKYAPAARDRMAVAKRVFEKIQEAVHAG